MSTITAELLYGVLWSYGDGHMRAWRYATRRDVVAAAARLREAHEGIVVHSVDRWDEAKGAWLPL